jgi:hypothetical protein
VLDPVVSEAIKASLEPMLDQFKPPFISKMGFQRITLGELPVVLEGIRVSPLHAKARPGAAGAGAASGGVGPAADVAWGRPLPAADGGGVAATGAAPSGGAPADLARPRDAAACTGAPAGPQARAAAGEGGAAVQFRAGEAQASGVTEEGGATRREAIAADGVGWKSDVVLATTGNIVSGSGEGAEAAGGGRGAGDAAAAASDGGGWEAEGQTLELPERVEMEGKLRATGQQ